MPEAPEASDESVENEEYIHPINPIKQAKLPSEPKLREMINRTGDVFRFLLDKLTFTGLMDEKHVFEAESNLEVNQIADNAQLYCKADLQNRIRKAKEDEVIILEHQLLKKKQRAFFLDAVKEVTDTPVECIVMSPTDEMVKKLIQDIEQLFIFYEYDKGKFEMPELDEGFASIKIERPVKE